MAVKLSNTYVLISIPLFFSQRPPLSEVGYHRRHLHRADCKRTSLRNCYRAIHKDFEVMSSTTLSSINLLLDFHLGKQELCVPYNYNNDQDITK